MEIGFHEEVYVWFCRKFCQEGNRKFLILRVNGHVLARSSCRFLLVSSAFYRSAGVKFCWTVCNEEKCIFLLPNFCEKWLEDQVSRQNFPSFWASHFGNESPTLAVKWPTYAIFITSVTSNFCEPTPKHFAVLLSGLRSIRESSFEIVRYVLFFFAFCRKFESTFNNVRGCKIPRWHRVSCLLFLLVLIWKKWKKPKPKLTVVPEKQ